MPTVKVSAKGSVVIPAEIRKKHRIPTLSWVEITDIAGVIQLIPIPDDPIKAGKGMFQKNQSVNEILKEDRASDEERLKRLLEIGLK